MGKSYVKKFSIPQGCPFSMIWISLLLRAWILMMHERSCVPRVLADDLCILSIRPDLEPFIDGYECTHKFLYDMGAKIASNKSYLFSSSASFRDWLRSYKWPDLQKKVSVVSNFRDLGTHLNVSNRFVGTTLSARIGTAIDFIFRIRRLPIGYLEKGRLIQAKALALGLYGCEAAWANETELSRLTTAIANTISPHSTSRSNDLSFSVFPDKREVEPAAVIFLRRAKMFRRMVSKHEHLLPIATQVLQHYREAQYVGTVADDADLLNLIPAPSPGRPHRAAWKPSVAPLGPIGLLLYSCHQFGLALGHDFEVQCKHENDIPLLHTPLQFLTSSLRHLINLARMHHIRQQRRDLSQLGEIDFRCLRSSITSFADSDDNRQIRCLLTLSSWTDGLLSERGIGDGVCRCGHSEPRRIHFFWECPNAISLFTSTISALSNMDLPINLALGIPEIPPLDPDVLFYNRNGLAITTENIATLLDIKWPKDYVLFHAQKHHRESLPALGASITNPRLLFQHHSGPFIPTPWQAVEHCPDNAPVEPNKFSDGTVTSPATPEFSLGAAGIWHPGRQLECAPLTANESSATQQYQNTSGLEVFGALFEPATNSTRTEIAGGIMAICSPGPVHLASDNKSFVNTATQMLATINWKPTKHWNMLSDGDLWRRFEEVCRQKGKHAVRVTWVPSHTGDEALAAGAIPVANQAGNRIADSVADKGANIHGAGMVQLSKVYGRRAKAQHELLRVLHCHLLLIQRNDNEARKMKQPDRILAVGDCDDLLTVPRTIWATTEQYEIFTVHLTDPSRLGQRNANHQLMQIWAFLSTLRFCIAPDTSVHTQGTSWLELFAHFELSGGASDMQPSHHRNKAVARCTVRNALALFKGRVRYVLSVCSHQSDAAFFKPSRSKVHSLTGIGFSNFVACVQGRWADCCELRN